MAAAAAEVVVPGDPVVAPSRRIRELRETDAAAAAEIALAVNPHQVESAEAAWHRVSRAPERAHRRDWVAEVDGEIVGHATASLAVSKPGSGRFWIGVLPDRRGRGVGGELYRHVDEHLRSLAVRRLRSWVDADPAGELFLRRRGFEHRGSDCMSAVDPREVDLSQLVRFENAQAEGGMRLVTLGDARERVEGLFEVYKAGELDMPGHEQETELELESWRRNEFERPNLSDEGSFVALAGERPVSLAFVTVDLGRRVGYNQMTATLPEFRRRGLATLVKLAAARSVAASGIERLLTENDAENTQMLAINDRLGYRPLYEQTFWVLERAS